MGYGTVMKNEALRLLLAVTALILTAMLTNTSGSLGTQELDKQTVAEAHDEATKKAATQERKTAQAKDEHKNESKKKTSLIKTVHKATRSFAFFYRR